MTPEAIESKIAEFKQLETKAAKAPWSTQLGCDNKNRTEFWILSRTPLTSITSKDADFICALRNDAISVMEAQQELIKSLESEIANLKTKSRSEF
jgi:hypothetical protein